MTDNEIIKALKRCFINENCDGCPLFVDDGGDCLKEVGIAAIDLINRQKEDVAKKDIEIDILIRKKENLRDVIAELQKQIQDYAHTIVMLDDHNKEMHRCCDYAAKNFVADAKRIKADAIKEFAERLKTIYGKHLFCGYQVLNAEIDNLVKEMTEGGEAE